VAARTTVRHARDAGRVAGDAGRDVLSDALRLVAFRGIALNTLELAGRWALESPPAAELGAWLLPGAEHVIGFHLIVEGPCWAWLPGRDRVALGPGDVVAFPLGDGHVLASDPERRPTRVDGEIARVHPDELPVVIRRGRSGANARVICGFVGCDRRPFFGMLGSLPPMFAVSPSHATDAALRTALVTAIEQAAPPRAPGSSEVVARLVELVFVDALRRHLAVPASGAGWLAAVHDPLVGAALASVHRAPAERWTVESLARAAGASRTVLAERFVRLLGEPPMQYVTRWRIELAAHQLRQSTAGTSEIAAAVGYASPAAFHRAFTRMIGATPAQWRQRGT
jgi:AraC-like DNA-binding protein